MGHVRGRLIAFDLDGTLIDSSRDLADSVNELLAEIGAPELPHDRITKMVGEGAKALVRRALAASGMPEPPGAIPRFLEIYDRRLLNHTQPYGGILDVVRAARAHARVSVLTNKPTVPTEKVLAGLGMRELFDDVIGSDGPYPRKPDPSALRALMEVAGATPASALMIGDSLIDYQTAAAAQAQCCLVSYGFSHHTCDGAAISGASIVSDVASLAEVVRRFVAAE